MKRYHHPFLDQPIENIKGVGPAKATLLQKERGLFTVGDVLFDYPFRYEDRTKIYPIREVGSKEIPVQIVGRLTHLDIVGSGKKTRLVGKVQDATGSLELVWFRSAKWLKDHLSIGKIYLVYGKVHHFNGFYNIPHPEMELFVPHKIKKAQHYAPVYASTEKLNRKGLDYRGRRKLIIHLLKEFEKVHLPENLSSAIIKKLGLCTRKEALQWIHKPNSDQQLEAATYRIKFEEFFFIQLHLLKKRWKRKMRIKGHVFEEVGASFMQFYNEVLPFSLTRAQQRVMKEIRSDLKKGFQMNRLLQGDVGSGKTIIALMTALLAKDNGFQTCLMAPTEILAQQHYQSFKELLDPMEVKVGFLSGSVKGKTRTDILHQIKKNEIDILIGTHALIEPTVEYYNLGLAITDEQHRFGVKQRAALWKKNPSYPPHILVMTATPIPRTLAMTLYGDLDRSIIDELPPGRKPVHTFHVFDSKRMEVYQKMREEIHKGRQIYIVYPLIEESAALELRDLLNGYERLLEIFPRPAYQLSMVHGQMKPEDKDTEMQRFVEGKSQIMVATTVIEVGVNVPNASFMLIENAERFGLSQLHQLRGRVGRGADQSYCVLMSDRRLSKEASFRLQTMCRTNDGFEIAKADLELRGPGEITGTRQSGELGLNLANLVDDKDLLQKARSMANQLIDSDPELEHHDNTPIQSYIKTVGKAKEIWSFIS